MQTPTLDRLTPSTVTPVPNPTRTTQASSSTNFSLDLKIAEPTAHLPGSIVFIEQRGYPNHRIARFHFATQTLSTLFTIPKGALVYQLDTSPDGAQVVMSYTGPDADGNVTYDHSEIYLLDITNDMDETMDDTVKRQEEMLVSPTEVGILYYDPVWSPDGRFIYYIRYVPDAEPLTLSIERYHTETQTTEHIATNGLWPQLSPDGTRLVYLAINPETQVRSLVIADADGGNPQTLVAEDKFYDLDLPVFSPDGAWVYFSVPRDPTASSWLERLLGVKTVYAHGNHNVLGDWWRIAVKNHADTHSDEPTIEQVDADAPPAIMMYGEFAPADSTYFGYTSHRGLYVVDTRSDIPTTTLVLKSRAIRVFSWLDR
ncbi:MAG: hypothetical protein AAF639_02455 [Chloroflexota bacterium]